MTRSRLVFFLCSAALVLSVLSGSLLGAVTDGETEDDSLYKHLSVFTEVLSLIRQAYVDAPDMEALMAGALDGTTDALDPFSMYVPAPEVQAYEEARGIGTRHSGLTLLKERGVAYVVAVDPGSPADEAGIEAGDLVTEIAGRNTRVMPLWEVKAAVAAEPGTEVDLDILRVGDAISKSLTLGPFDTPLPSLDTVDGTPVLRIPAFLPETELRVGSLLEQVADDGHDRLVVDVRGVAGGEPEAAYAVAELFTAGRLGSLLSKGEALARYEGEEDSVAWSGTVVVLVSRGTLGPAEILASVLRQRMSAELVGERTFGWAGRQDSAELASGGRLYFTEAFYAGPDGEPIAESLRPDTTVDRRAFADRDRPLAELILERGVERVNTLAGPAREAA